MKFCTADYVYRNCCLMFVELSIFQLSYLGTIKGYLEEPRVNTKRDENNTIIVRYGHIHIIKNSAWRPVKRSFRLIR